MQYRNWTLVLGTSGFIGIAAIALLTGATLTTSVFRAVVASFLGGIFGLGLDYFAAQAEHPPAPRPQPAAAAGTPADGAAELE